MSAILLEQTARTLSRQVQRWDRRLRLAESLLWVPRGVIVGLFLGVSMAVISRLRPWLLSEEIALATTVITAASGLGALALVWLWPRTTAHAARHFDHRFDLHERISTALELSNGAIPYPERLAERQLSDAVGSARGVQVGVLLPLRVRAWELVLLVVLAGLLALLLLSDNPQADELLAQRDLQNAIDEQAEALEEAVEEIEASEALTPEEKEALTNPLEEAQNVLEQPGISQQEAIAALAEAEQELNELSDGMLAEQQAAYQEAASSLAGSSLTSELAQALQRPDLGATADALENLSNALGESDLSEAERNDLADRLEQAAESLEETNPALAERLREAAEALREGDTEAVQQSLDEAADLLRRQQEQLENSPMAEAAQDAQQQVAESQHDLSQAGQEQPQEPSSSQQQPGQQQPGQQSQAGQQQQGQQGQQQNQQGQQGQPQAGQMQAAEGQQGAQQGQQGQQPGQAGQEGQPQLGEGQGQGEQGESAAEGAAGQGEASEGAEASSQQGQSEGQGQQPAGEGQSESASEAEAGSASAPGAGEGEGGAGVDSVTGPAGDGSEISSETSPSGEGEGLQDYTPGNDPTNIGGPSGETVDVEGISSDPSGEPLQEGEFGPNPTGQSQLSYTGVYSNYRGAIGDALESGRIPLDQRDVIHDYFSSLEPE